MKYFSVIFFAVALAVTWNVIHSKPDVSFETHSGIQEKLAELIKNSILAKKPGATDVVIEKIWTEMITADKVKASFIYSYKNSSDEGPVTTRISGQGNLERKNTSGEMNHWVLTNFETTTDNIEFNDATLVTGSSSAPAENPMEKPAEESSVAEPKNENHSETTH